MSDGDDKYYRLDVEKYLQQTENEKIFSKKEKEGK